MEIEFPGAGECSLFAFTEGDDASGSPLHRAPVVVLMHGGGPDHRSLVPLARELSDTATVILPDVRGYGRSVCRNPAHHTWSQYADDVISLLDHLGLRSAVIGGAGLGATISLRTALAFSDRVAGLILISVEDIEDDAAKRAEIAFMEAFAARMRQQGPEAAWSPILPDLAPVIGSMVRDSMATVDRESAVAAAAIGYDRAFRTIEDLIPIDVPTLIIPGTDWRHPAALATRLAERLQSAQLAQVGAWSDLPSAAEFGQALAPAIREFILTHRSEFTSPG